MSNSLETIFFLILENIKKRNYQQALQLVDKQLQKDDNSFDAWSFWLLGGICFAYEDKYQMCLNISGRKMYPDF